MKKLRERILNDLLKLQSKNMETNNLLLLIEELSEKIRRLEYDINDLRKDFETFERVQGHTNDELNWMIRNNTKE